MRCGVFNGGHNFAFFSITPGRITRSVLPSIVQGGTCVTNACILWPQVAAIIDTLKPFVHGWSLAGAGGGGYLTVVMKEPNSAQKLRDALAGSSLVSTDAATIHSIVVDVDGLEVEVGDE